MMFEFEILEGVQLLVMAMSRGIAVRLGGQEKIGEQDHWSGKGRGTVRSECWKDDLHACVGERPGGL